MAMTTTTTTVTVLAVKINTKGVTVCGVVECSELVQTAFSVQ
jgi:hypothetical protein